MQQLVDANMMNEVMLGMRTLEAQMQELLARDNSGSDGVTLTRSPSAAPGSARPKLSASLQEATQKAAPAPAAGSDVLDAEATAWLEEKGLSGRPFAAVLGGMCTNLADMAMVTQGDLANLALKAMEKRRLSTALAALPESALGAVAKGGEAPAVPQKDDLEEALRQQLARGPSETAINR